MYPSRRPTFSPTFIPSFKPSLIPVTLIPSGSPVFFPTIIPTSLGNTNPPTAIPSSLPTWNLRDYKSKRIYQSEYFPLVNLTNTLNTRIIFSSFTYKGYVKEGGCTDWKLFASTTLNLVVTSYYFSNITVTFGYQNFRTVKHTNVTASCSTAATVSEIVSAIQSKTISSTYPDYTTSCSGNLWRVFTCYGAPVLCVNCSGGCQCPGLSTYLTSSCDPSCLTNTAAYSHIIFDIKQQILYPKLSIRDILVGSNYIDIVANISSAGILYCSAIIGNATLSSVYQVRQYGSSAVVLDYTKQYTLTLSDLSPSTTYSIYCYSEEATGNGMDLSTVVSSREIITTRCCPSVIFTATHSNIVEYSTDDTTADSSVFSFTLEKTPTMTQTVNLMITRVVCTSGISSSSNTSNSKATAYPSSFLFTSDSLVLSGNFVVHGSPGCYEIIASGNELRNATLPLIIYNSTTIVSPSIKSAYFSGDGSSLYIVFDSSTNYGKSKILNYASGFACSELLLFTGSSSFTCKWLSNKLIYAYLAVKSSDTPSVGDTVQLISGVLNPSCFQKVCSASSSATVPIRIPSAPIDPTAALAAPRLISSCSNIILDPTASIGQGLKDWSSVQWYVSSSDFDTSLIDSFLNIYHNNTTKTITIPNSYLTTGSVTFTLYLTNFLSLSSFATATVVISSYSDIPYTTISGSSTLSVYRWQSVTLFASATTAYCDQTSSNRTALSFSSLSYSWKVYQGLTYQSSLSSSSLNPRYFKLPAYSLNTLSQYTIQVTTTSLTTVTFSSASVLVYVKQSGIVASINGGAKRVASTYLPLVLDATASYDKDNDPTQLGSGLSYFWSCVLLSPDFGEPCGLTLNGTSVINIPAYTLPAKTYNFTVVVVSNRGAISSTYVTIITMDETLANVNFNNLKAKYNPEDRLIVASSVTATDALKTDWSCPGCGFNFSDITLTPITLFFNKGKSVLELSLASGSFASGLSYTLQLSLCYYNRSQPVISYSQLTIVMNAPPVQGLLTVEPTIGFSSTTSFSLNTFGWIDDASDYPLGYTLSYYSKDVSSTGLIKSRSSIQYAYAYIGQGLSVRNFTITCVATASDIYGCSGSVDRIIRVLPPASISSLQSSMIEQLTLATETSNPDLTIQTSSAVASYLNAASCSAAPDCGSLNRYDCDTVMNTCGPCISGYLGVAGYANSACQLSSSLRVTGDACSSRRDCVSNNCRSNVCTLSLKACSNNCSGNGFCQFFDSNNNKIASCDANSYFCKAKCNCYFNSYGSDCSLSLSNYNLRLSMREKMCISLYEILDIQDVTSDVIIGRTTLLSSLLLDITQLTNNALSNCTLALTTTVQQYPSLCVEDSVYENVITSLSAVVESGTYLSTLLSTQISIATDILLVNRQLVLGVNDESSVVSTNLRLYSTVTYKSDLVHHRYTLPQSALEIFTQIVPVHVQIGSTANDASAMVRVSLSQTNINYRNATTDASIVKLQVSYDYTTANTTAKLFMQNNKKIDYASSDSYNSTVYCTTSSTSYYKSANCSEDPSLVVYCPGTTTRIVTVICPSRQSLPQCLSWNGFKYHQDPFCKKVAYSPYNTTCECSGSESTSYVSRRKLDVTLTTSDANRMAGEFSASASIEVQAFVSTWKSADELNTSTLTRNYYIVLTVSFIAAFFILGFFNITCKSYFFPEKEESKTRTVAEHLTLTNTKVFFDSILPVEFKFRPWYANFWIKLLECHPHLAYFAPARGRRLYHTKKWLGFCFEVLFFIFMDSIFSPLANADDSTCAAYVTEASCIQPVSFDLINTVCVWDAGNSLCELNPPQNTFAVTIIVVLVSSLCAQPASSFAEYLIDRATAKSTKDILKGVNEMGRIQSNNSIVPEGALKKDSLLTTEDFLFRQSTSNKVAPIIITNDDSGVEVRPVSPTTMVASMTPLRRLSLNVTSGKNNDQTYAVALSNNLIVEDFDIVEVFNDIDMKGGEITTFNINNNLGDIAEHKTESQNSTTLLRKSILKLQIQSLTKQTTESVELVGDKNDIHLMTIPSLIMLGARLALLQQRLDRSSLEEELEWLMSELEDIYETDIIAESTTTISLLHTLNNLKSTITADRYITEMTAINSYILNKISRVRRRTEKLITDLHEMETEEMKEKYLIKKFIVELKKGVFKKVIFQHFFELEEDEDEGNPAHWIVRVLSVLCLIGMAFGCLFYIFLTGVSLGQSTTILWLEVLVIGVLQDVFILKPIGIWFRFIAMASIVSSSVRHVTDLIRERVPLILRRTRGVVCHNSLFMQHFNAACRAARAFPHLQTSRLLIALNDYDLPKSLPKKRSQLKLFLDLLFLSFVLIILMLTMMPELVQEVMIESSVNALFNFHIYLLLLLAKWTVVALPVLIVCIVIFVYVLREFRMYRNRKSMNN